MTLEIAGRTMFSFGMDRHGPKLRDFVMEYGTRLARPFQDLVPIAEVGATLRPLFARYRHERGAQEGFGDFCDRVGFEALKATIEEARATRA